jgi:hypothetical protein
VVNPIGMILSGVFLILVNRFFKLEVSTNSFTIIVLCLLTILVVLGIRKNYLQMLIAAFATRKIVSFDFKLGKENLELLKKRLKSPFGEEVIYALKLIEKLDQKELIFCLKDALEHPVREVQEFAIQRAAQYGLKELSAKIETFCSPGQCPETACTALLALGKLGTHFSRIQELTREKDKRISAAALAVLLQHGSKEMKRAAVQEIKKDRMTSLLALKYIDLPDKVEIVIENLDHPDVAVKEMATQAALRIQDERLIAPLLKNWEIKHLYNETFKALVFQGNALAFYLMKHFDQFPLSFQSDALQLLGFVESPGTLPFLYKQIQGENRKNFHAALSSLQKQKFHFENSEEAERLLDLENTHLVQLQTYIEDLSEDSVLQAFLLREMQLGQERCFLLLSFLYSTSPILLARDGMHYGNEEMISLGTEILLQTLNSKHIKTIIPQLIYTPSGKGVSKNSASHLKALLSESPNASLKHFPSAVLFAIGTLKLTALRAAVQAFECLEDPLVAEIKPWVLRQLPSS